MPSGTKLFPLLCHSFCVHLYPLAYCFIVIRWLLYLQAKCLYSSQEVEERISYKGWCQSNVRILLTFFFCFKSGDTKALPEIPPNKNLNLTCQNYITWSVRQAGTFEDGGSCWVANQERNGYTVLLTHTKYSKFQGKPIEQTWKGVGESNFEVN